MSTEIDDLLQQAEQAHGHLCAGQILGVRMAMLALARLNIRNPRARFLPTGELNPERKRLVSIVEIDRCATDAIGVVTGCRIGKRALKLVDFGKMAATFVDLDQRFADTDDYRGLRIVALESSKQRAAELYPTLDKNAAQMKAYRELPDEDLFRETWVKVPLPPSEFPGYKGTRVACDACGEGINFDRFTERNGQRLCQACANPQSLYYQAL